MFALLGRLFGSDAATGKVIEHASSALDKLIYTSEEKADRQAEDTAKARGMVIDWLQATSGQNLARRILALMIATVWLLQYVSAQVLSIASVWAETPEATNKLIASSSIISTNAAQMDGAMMLLLSFYFAAPYMGRIVEGAMTKFGTKPPPPQIK